MKKQQRLSRDEMKNVTGGIRQDQVWVICNVNGTQTQELSPCAPCPYCTTGTFVRYAYSGDETRCPCLL
ncbi:bacteriocin-like protein [Mucilaginibacter sp. OK098]|uniref:bacteriocin-like protein n=1 Tax=Mucilaginibacter sp. OK098 TaxID=1855297 RepID=UPI001161469A|nr:hypothetical protein [Mucilaginibacter sp. OK098]